MSAGLGSKTFLTGDVLTAADVNGYLMQGVLVFASAAARAAAITAPQEGQYSYLKDTNSTEYYDGAAWIAAPIGDITGVTAGTGISGGGTSGTVTITNSMATEITAKGDLIAGTGSATFDNLPVGTNAQVLTADSTAATGLKWATPSAGTTFPAFAAYKSTAQTGITATTWTKVTFDTERFDTAGNFASSRFTPTTAGYYQINSLLLTADGGNITTAYYKNGSAYTRIGYAPSPSGNEWIHTSPSLIYFNGSSDYLEIYVYMSAGSARTIYGTTEVSDFSGVGVRA